jgi:hypothetical protein
VIRTVVWTVASISAGGPYPSASYAPRLVPIPAKVVAMHCAGECPTPTDQAASLAKLLTGFRHSTSTAQWLFGSSGPYTSAWV